MTTSHYRGPCWFAGEDYFTFDNQGRQVPDKATQSQEWTIYSGDNNSKGERKSLGPEIWVRKDGRVEVFWQPKRGLSMPRGRPKLGDDLARHLEKYLIKTNHQVGFRDVVLEGIWRALQERDPEPFRRIAKALEDSSKLPKPAARESQKIGSIVKRLAKKFCQPPSKASIREEYKREHDPLLTDDAINKKISLTGWGWLPDGRGRPKKNKQ